MSPRPLLSSTANKTKDCSQPVTTMFSRCISCVKMTLACYTSVVCAGNSDAPRTKREEYLSWDEYFMAVALLASKCSEDDHTKVGACIVTEDKKIIGIGYNSMPERAHERRKLPWKHLDHHDPKRKPEQWLKSKYPYVCYAAKNAVLSSNRADLTNCVLYTSLFPSNECAKILIQAHIKEVIYLSDKYADRPETEASKRMFRRAHVKLRQLDMRARKINIHIDLKKGESFLETKVPMTAPTSSQEAVQIKWGENLFMAMALLSALRSKDPKTQVGACIVNNDKQIVGIGYNSMPVGCHDDDISWDGSDVDKLSDKHSYVCHAELNAVMNRNCSHLKRCRIFQTLYPCCECAKILLQSGIKEVCFLKMKDDHSTKPEFVASTRLLGKHEADGRLSADLFAVYDEELNSENYSKPEEDNASSKENTGIIMRKFELKENEQHLININFNINN